MNRKRTLRSIVSVLAAIVVFVTTYALIIPAITMEKMLICEIPEHTHTDSCYRDGELICGKTEHVHTDACYDAPKAVEPIYICGHTEHIHTEECYFSDGTLKCTHQEHVHTDACLFVNAVRLTSNLLLSGEEAPEKFYDVDPDTSDLLALFKINGSYNVQNDGKVAVDKSVFEVTTEDQFRVVLSALGQSYIENLTQEEMIHPDIVFVVDISSSMNTGDGQDIDPKKNGNQTRFAAVADCLNYAISEMLAADPESRIGIVAYSEVVMDGTVPAGRYTSSHGTKYDYGGTGLYLPLDYYNILPDGDYVKISGSGNADSENDWQKIGINTALTNKSGTHMQAYETKALHGTNTQMGLLGALRMFRNVENKQNREPVLILITDGEPRSANQNVDGTNRNSNPGYLSGNNKKSDLFQQSWHEIGYWTIRTAIDVKNQINQLYKTANPNSQDDMFFYTMGPGVTSLYGKTILDPSSDNLALCAAASDGGNSYSAYDLQNILLNGQSANSGHDTGNLELPALTENERKYSDFADWSLSGALTPQELEEGMAIIIANMTKIPRPVVTSAGIEHLGIIDTNSMMSIEDTLGKGMELNGFPQLIYGTNTITAMVTREGTLGSGDGYTSEYVGLPFKLYHFIGSETIRETSTGKSLDFAKILLYEITVEDGSTVLLWQFPAELLPVIYHNPSTNTIIPTEPLRLEFNVRPADGFIVPGETYYSNSTEHPAAARYTISDDNPYYNTVEKVDGKDIYTPKNLDEETEKTDNVTDTLDNSSEYDQTGLSMNVILGNNGKLVTPLRLDVFKKWQGSGTHPDSITVYLYADGVNTGHYVTLSDANGWTDSFDFNGLGKYDSEGREIVYSVRENPVPDGYTVTGENDEPHVFTSELETSVTVPAKWESAASIVNGNTYRIRRANEGTVALKDNGSGSVGMGSVSGSTTDTTEQWYITSSGNMKNVKSGKYLGIRWEREWQTWKAYLDYSANISATVSFNPNANSSAGVILLHTSVGDYYLPSEFGSNFYLDRLVPESVETVTETRTLYGFELVNKPLELTVSAEKIWGFGTAGMEREVILQVYEKSSGGHVSTKGTITLNSDGDWKGTYILSSVASGSTYYVAEVGAGNFNVSYSGGQIENLTYGGNTFPAVKVDVQHEAKIEVTNNTNSIELPSTGSFGPDYLYGFGALLTAGALIIGLILWRRREGGSEM